MSGSWAGAWRIARRDLNPGLRGLRLLFICLFLGVATLAAIGSLSASITGEIATQGQRILGGDLEVGMAQRRASAEERAAFAALGTVSETVRMRAMARGGEGAALAELKGVDGAYPLYGELLLHDGPRRGIAAGEALVDPALADRLGLGVGDPLRFGEAQFRIAGLIAEEPDRVGEGLTLGPVALVSLDGLGRTGLVQPGSLFETKYRIRLPSGLSPGAAAGRLSEAFPSAGWTIRDRDRAAPGASRFFDRMGQFLSLIGLAALFVAGIGVSNGVASYLAARRGGIATLKVLGAGSGDIARIYMMQIGAVASLAIGLGLAIGALVPPLLVAVAGEALPIRPGLGLHPLPLASSAASGLLIALIFTLPPLGQARLLPAAALFRDLVERRRRLDWKIVLPVLLAAAALAALALGTSDEPAFAATVLGGTGAALLLLMAIGWAVRLLARRLPRPRRPLVRLAFANLHRPGAQTVPLVVALGLGLTLFVTIAAVQSSMEAEITRSVPERAPDQFVLDIPVDEQERFRKLVLAEAPGAQLNVVPTLRGSIVAYAGRRVADLDELPDGAWFLRGERGLTYSETIPEGSDLVEGQWWPAGYAGPPLVSLDREAARTLGIGVGDTLTVSLLGREIEARIASLRQVNWDTMGFNYIMVFDPASLTAAPHNLAATISLDGGDRTAVTRALLGAFPAVSVIDVGEIVGRVADILRQMSLAIFLTASVAVLAGIAVLIGAISAARQARTYDSVILKTLGATRGQILAAQGLEYALLAALLALVALGLGIAAARYIIVGIFEFGWAPDWLAVLGTLAGGVVLTLGIGLLGSIPLISVRPARALRRLP